MPVAVGTIMQSGQVSIPKVIREILGVGPGDQIEYLSDGERVEVRAVPEPPVRFGSAEEFYERIARADAEYEAGLARPLGELVSQARERYGL